MKVSLSEDESRQRRAAALRGALEGGLVGAGLTLPSFFLLNSGAIVTAPLVATLAEKRNMEFNHKHWSELGKSHFERREHEGRERWATLSLKDKVADWTANHQLSVITRSWATTTVVAGGIIMSDPLLTTPQKVVQVRLWAQGLTVGVVIATAVLTHAHHAQALEMRKRKNQSWQDSLDGERLEKDPHKIPNV